MSKPFNLPFLPRLDSAMTQMPVLRVRVVTEHPENFTKETANALAQRELSRHMPKILNYYQAQQANSRASGLDLSKTHMVSDNIELRHTNLNGTPILEVIVKVDAQGDELCLMVLHGGNKITAIPMAGVYKGTFKSTFSGTLKQSAWPSYRRISTQMCVDKDWTAFLSGVSLSDRIIQDGTSVNAIPISATGKITSAPVDGDVRYINGANGTVYTNGEQITWTAQDGVRVALRNVESGPLASDGQPATGNDYNFENVPLVSGKKLTPTSFGTFGRDLNQTFGEQSITGTWTVVTLDIGPPDSCNSPTTATPVITPQSDTEKSQGLVSRSYNGISLGSASLVTTTTVVGSTTYWLKDTGLYFHPVQVWVINPLSYAFSYGTDRIAHTYFLGASQDGSVPAGYTQMYDTTPNTGVFPENLNSPIIYGAANDLTILHPEEAIATNICGGYIEKSVTTFTAIGTFDTTRIISQYVGEFKWVEVIMFPYAYTGKEYFGIGDQSTETVYTPYGEIATLNFRGWLNLSDGGALIQGYTANDSVYIYCNGQEVSQQIAEACKCAVDDIQTMVLDVPLARIKEFR